MNLNRLHIPASWRRRLSNLGLLAGLSLIAAPPAMRIYGTWWEDRQTALFLAQADETPVPDAPTATGATPAATDAARPRVQPPTVRKAPSKGPARTTVEAKKPSAQPARAKAVRRAASKHPDSRVSQARVRLASRDSLLQIPSIGVEAVVKRAGGNWRFIKGPAFDPKSPAPGEPGNTVIAAHRNMWASTFADLPRVKPGDRIAIQSKGKRHIYVVELSRKVRTSETSLLANTKEPRVTLYTCLVPYRANQRWVVRGRLVDTRSAATSTGRLARGR